MAALGGEQTATVLAVEEPVTPADAAAPVAAGRRSPLALVFYWAHAAGLFSIALSNVLLGVSTLAVPWARPLEGLRRRAVRPLLLALAAYVALLGLSALHSFDPRRSARALSEVFALCTLLLGLALVKREHVVRRLRDAVLLLVTAESLVGLVQLVVAGGPDLARRPHGTLSHYMTFSGMLLIGDLLLLAELASRGRRMGWRALALLPINAALLGTLTRSAWVGLAAGFVALVLLSRRRVLLWWVPVMLLLLLVMPPAVLERAVSIVDPADPTNSDRLCMAQAGFEMIRERPLLGQGPDMVKARYPLYRLPAATRYTVPHLHDAFLEVAAERGLPALAALLLLLGLPLARALAGYQREGARHGPRAELWLGVVVALVGFSVAGLFENNWGDIEVQRLVLLLAALPYGLGVPEEPALRSG
ncbi:MAG TPA: O-antigen ligase family protein [Thermoanaerobaculia bacterium]|jgi:O-antigen ligase|nr:O-antigen ligase family protein [Thermoanaerobaculia bacterium]